MMWPWNRPIDRPSIVGLTLLAAATDDLRDVLADAKRILAKEDRDHRTD